MYNNEIGQGKQALVLTENKVQIDVILTEEKAILTHNRVGHII